MTLADRIIARLKAELGDFTSPAKLEAAARGVLEVMRGSRPQCEPMRPDEDGWSEWIHPLPGYRMQCCDCGLIHEMEFAIGETRDKGGPLNDGEGEDGVVIFRARREEAALSPEEVKG